MIPNRKSLALIAGAVALVVTTALPAALAAKPNMPAGNPRASAKSNVNRPGGGAGRGAGSNAGRNIGGPANNRPGGNNVRGGNNNVRGGGNNIGNTVVVAPNRGGGGNYNNGRYNNNGNYNNNNGHWEDDDNDFLEFVGKTAAITAGVSIVAAVIGSTTNTKPDNCQQSVSNGQVYMNCNGTWYQPMQNGSQTQYTVVTPPR